MRTVQFWGYYAGSSGKSVRNYHYWMCNNSEEQSYHLRSSSSLKSS